MDDQGRSEKRRTSTRVAAARREARHDQDDGVMKAEDGEGQDTSVIHGRSTPNNLRLQTKYEDTGGWIAIQEGGLELGWLVLPHKCRVERRSECVGLRRH